MATFEYNALTLAGRLMKGTIEAGTLEEASTLLRQMELTVNSIEKAKPPKLATSIGRNEFLLFNQQLASITRAGIPLEKGLRELASDMNSKSMRRLINSIADELEAGVSIEQAFEKRQKQFPPLYGRILKAGVETGRLSDMLTSLNRQLEVSNQTKRIVFEAMMYPAVVFVLASVVFTVVLLIIVPAFEAPFRDLLEGGHIHPLTQFVFTLSRNVIPFWVVIGSFIAVILSATAILSTFAAGRRFKESLLLKIPVMGSLYHSSILSKLAEAMSLMIATGCSMPDCIRLSAGATGNEKLLLETNTLASQIEHGTNILEAGQFCKLIPRLFLYSIQLGSQRNELQDNLSNLSQMYASQVRGCQARLQAFLLPVMIVAVGIFIGMCITAMFLPMIQVVSGLK